MQRCLIKGIEHLFAALNGKAASAARRRGRPTFYRVYLVFNIARVFIDWKTYTTFLLRVHCYLTRVYFYLRRAFVFDPAVEQRETILVDCGKRMIRRTQPDQTILSLNCKIPLEFFHYSLKVRKDYAVRN